MEKLKENYGSKIFTWIKQIWITASRDFLVECKFSLYFLSLLSWAFLPQKYFKNITGHKNLQISLSCND